MIDTAMPSARDAIARRIALTISPTSLLVDPVHCTLVPSSAAASELPFFAGTKNGFVSAWLTKTKRHCGWGCGKLTSSAFRSPSGTAPTAAAPAARRRSAARSSGGVTPAAAGRARA